MINVLMPPSLIGLTLYSISEYLTSFLTKVRFI